MREEFTDAQKAEIYVRDHALCAFSGKSLWILDYGISPTYEIDWVDHIKPASRGGGSTVGNGVCASYFHNSKKRANSADNKYLFFAGLPTPDFYYFNEVIADETIDHLKRFSHAVTSDWYFNRAIFRFMLGMDWIREESTGKQCSRDAEYYSKSSFKILQKWKRLSSDHEQLDIRGLLPPSITSDQSALLRLKDCESEKAVLEHMKECSHWYNSACDAIERLSEAKCVSDFLKLFERTERDSSLPSRAKSIVLENSQKMIWLLEN